MTVHSRLTRFFKLLCLLTGLLIFTTAARAQHPADHWEFSVQTGYLKKVKNNLKNRVRREWTVMGPHYCSVQRS